MDFKVGQRLRRRLQKCLQASDFDIIGFRNIAMSVISATSIADVTFYYQMRHSITYGQLPWYSVDILIICIGLFEATMAVFWSRFGRCRLKTLAFTTLLISLASLGLWVLPSVPVSTGLDFCSGIPASRVMYQGISTAGAIRLSIIIFAGALHAIASSATWNHSLVILQENDPGKLSIHYGTLILVRVLVLVLIPKMISEYSPPWMLWLGIFMPGLIHAFQYWRLPEPIPKDKDEDFERVEASDPAVLPSWLIVCQIVAVGLLVSALWGYMWHLKDILKMSFYVVEDSFIVTNMPELLYCVAIILAVAVVSLKSTKRAPAFKKESALKLAGLASACVAALYIVQTVVLTCDTGLVAGMNSQQNYTQPACSTHCGCAVPYSEFDPVCVTDTMTTYLSPCHAGCEGRDTIAGLTGYRKCACAPGTGARRATVGACNAVQCRSKYILHKAVTIVIVTLTVLALQAHLVSLVKSVRQRHQAAAIGTVTSVTLLLTFCSGHLLYAAIRATNCAWFEGGRYVLPSPSFRKSLGGVSTASAAFAACLSFVVWLIVWRRSRATARAQDINLTNIE